MPLLPVDEPTERISGDDTARYGAKIHVLGPLRAWEQHWVQTGVCRGQGR